MNSWKEKRFTDCILLNPSIKLENDSEYSFIEMADLGPENKYATPKRYRKPIGLTKFQEGDTLFAKITPCLENGNICQATKLDNGIGVGSTEFFVFRGKEGVIHNEFVYYLLRSYPIKEYAIRNMTGSAGQQRVPTDIFKTLVIPLPEYEESKRIGQFLSLFDRKISLLRRQNEILEEMAQALFRHWFIDFEFPISNEYAESIGKPEMKGEPYRSSGGEMITSECSFVMVPAIWEVNRLDSLIDVKRGGSPRPIHDFLSNQGLPWVKISDATATISPFIFSTKQFILEAGLKKTVYLKRGDLILSNSATPGIPKFLELDACIHDGWLYFPRLKTVSNRYLYCLFEQIRPFLLQQGSGSVFKNLKTDILKEFLIPVPSIEISSSFGQKVDPLFEKMKLNMKQINTLTEMRDTLLPKLMSGEVRL